tara:strand:- start:42 stop:629 length:588 start_codon:yes stop_codon:yes gene_type:complete
MTQKAEDLKRFISHQFDVYKKRLEIIEKKHFRDNCYEEMKEISDIGDISTLLDLLKELHSLDTKLFYDLCSKDNTELEDLIFDHGKLNGLDEIYISIKANKQRIIMRQEKYKKLELFYKIKKMKVQHKYKEEIRKIEEEYKIAQLNLTQSRRSKYSRQNIQLTDSNDSNDSIVITEKNLQINDQWEILNIEEIQI